jgi:hypothetical protein
MNRVKNRIEEILFRTIGTLGSLKVKTDPQIDFDLIRHLALVRSPPYFG